MIEFDFMTACGQFLAAFFFVVPVIAFAYFLDAHFSSRQIR